MHTSVYASTVYLCRITVIYAGGVAGKCGMADGAGAVGRPVFRQARKHFRQIFRSQGVRADSTRIITALALDYKRPNLVGV